MRFHKKCFFFLLILPLIGQAQTLSKDAEISVLTLGPDQSEVFTAFGHSAIRVADEANGFDLIYNYGVFDFNQPNFYLNFALGKLYYRLGQHSYNRFRDAYIQENRTIIEQVLNLDSAERQNLFDYLQWNAQPENQFYYYNYIYDNCATKIRDVLDTVLQNRVVYDYSFVEEELSFRDLMDLYLGYQPWGDFGIDLCLGLGIDKVATGYHYMYLPDYIERAFDKAVIKTSNGTKPLIRETVVTYQAVPEVFKETSVTPTIVFILVFFVFGFISFKDLKANKRTNWVDLLLFSTAGLIGCLLLFLWVFTQHISQYNFNLLWALPVHLPIALLLSKYVKPKFLKPYFLANSMLLGILIVLWGFWPQNLHDSLIPFALLLLMRSIIIYRSLK
ncbi:MAG: DUF4105 domain-containing protein [Bacteroidetes bacterium]|nr:DUF4105 domain-containing protein [Bacteroidota bacterium]MDA1119378.1 DUF4105 domain-containing protein [Bacteroidota bacterium]